MSSVYVVTRHERYENSTVVGVAATKRRAKLLAESDAPNKVLWGPPSDGCVSGQDGDGEIHYLVEPCEVFE